MILVTRVIFATRHGNVARSKTKSGERETEAIRAPDGSKNRRANSAKRTTISPLRVRRSSYIRLRQSAGGIFFFFFFTNTTEQDGSRAGGRKKRGEGWTVRKTPDFPSTAYQTLQGFPFRLPKEFFSQAETSSVNSKASKLIPSRAAIVRRSRVLNI